VQTVASLAGAPDAVGNADVIVFHCDWSKVSSIDLLDKLQRQAAGVPMVLLTGEASPARDGLALDKGAADVIGQSRSSEALARRLKGVVKTFGRTDQPQADGRMICGKLLLRPDVGRAYWKDTDLGLTLGEYNIVYLLASNVGRYVTYRAIYDRLHYEGFIASTPPSTRSRTTTASGTVGRSQTESTGGTTLIEDLRARWQAARAHRDPSQLSHSERQKGGRSRPLCHSTIQ